MSNELITGEENINDLLLDIMKQNNVAFVSVGMPATNHHHHYSIEQRMTSAVEDANHSIPNIVIEQTNYNTGGPTRTLSQEEIINEWYLGRFEYQLNLRQMFEHNYLLNDSYIKAEQDRLDQRHLSLEEFKSEVMSRNRRRNDWFRNKHEKKRFIKGL